MTLAQLLVVQAHDSAIDRLTHSRTVLPEFAALAMIDDEQAHLDAQNDAVAEQRHAIRKEQTSLEGDAAIVTDRIDRENERLYSGTITAHKELQALQAELETLGKRRAGFEDQVLELMEQGEPLDQNLAAIDQQLADLEVRRQQATESLRLSQASIDAEIESETAARAEAVAEVDAELVAIYEASRSSCGGVGIARLAAKTCEGCHLTLPAVELDRIRKSPDGEIVRCIECNRILVH